MTITDTSGLAQSAAASAAGFMLPQPDNATAMATPETMNFMIPPLRTRKAYARWRRKQARALSLGPIPRAMVRGLRVAARAQITRQVVMAVEPWKLIDGEDVGLWPEAAGLLKGTSEEMNFPDELLVLVGKRRAAAAAEAAAHARRGGEISRLGAREAQLVRLDHRDPGCHR